MYVSANTNISKSFSSHRKRSDEGKYCDVMKAENTILTILRYIWTISVYSLRLINIISC